MGRHLEVLELCMHQRRVKDLDLVGWLILEQTTRKTLFGYPWLEQIHGEGQNLVWTISDQINKVGFYEKMHAHTLNAFASPHVDCSTQDQILIKYKDGTKLEFFGEIEL